MKRSTLILIILIILVLLHSMIPASVTTVYSVSYAKSSQYKGLSLKNATLHIKLYVNGNPHKILMKKTNTKQSFTLDNSYGTLLVVEVLSIQGEPKQFNCHGTVQGGHTDIKIDCHLRSGKKHYN